jgi:tight adherence protein C
MSALLTALGWAGLLLLYTMLLLIAWLRKRKNRRLNLLADPFCILLEYRHLFDRLQPILYRVQHSLAILGGGLCTREELLVWTSESLGLAYIALLISGLLALMAGNSTLFIMGLIIAICIPVSRAKDLRNKVEKRRLEILMELPELLNRLLLLVNAGENVMRALSRCTQQKSDSGQTLYIELHSAIECMKRGESMSLSLEEMGRRCAVPEVKLFATTLLLNARRGGETFVPALRELNRQMWDKRKAIARMLAEQASTRLAFPLAVIFLLIMVLVGAPTMLMM